MPVEFFVGRSAQVRETLGYAQRAATGRHETVFLLGDRGIGKSSFATFTRQLIRRHDDMIDVHVFLGGVDTLEEMVRRIFEQLLKRSKDAPWFEKIGKFFGDHVKEVGLFGVSVGFAPPAKDLSHLVRNYPSALLNVMKELEGTKKGLMIVLDDIDQLAEKQEFADWLKSCSDHISTHYEKFPVLTVLIGTPDRRDCLANLQPSLMRIFRIIELEGLSDTEVRSFIDKAFKSTGATVDQDAMKMLVKYVGGIPTIMHEIGDATFRKMEANMSVGGAVVDSSVAAAGISDAAVIVGEKYLNPQVYSALRSTRYKSILRKLPFSTRFNKGELVTKLADDELKVLDNFLRRMVKLGVIVHDRDGGSGAYAFVNSIYPVYIWLEGQRYRVKKNKKRVVDNLAGD